MASLGAIEYIHLIVVNMTLKGFGMPNRRTFATMLPLGLAACAADRKGFVLPSETSITTLGGRVVVRGNADFESWRTSMPWQSWVADRYPALIVRPNNRAEAIAAVRYAGQNDFRVAVKSGGHNLSEAFLRDDSLLLDLGELQGMSVDPIAQTAWVEPSLWSQFLIKQVAQHNLAFPVAHCATVPMGGYLLGGGVGVNGDEWDTIACHSILAAEVLLADGTVVVASPEQHEDLYWAVRGAGTGFFGTVLRYKLKLYPQPSQVYESVFMFPLDQIGAAHELLYSLAQNHVRKTELMMLMAHNPMAANDPNAPAHICIARIVAFADSIGEANAILDQVEGRPAAMQAMFRVPKTTTSIEAMGKASVDWSRGLGFGRSAVDTVWTDDPGVLLDDLKRQFVASPSRHNHVIVSYKINPQLREDAAFSVIGDAFVGTYGVWEDPGADEANFQWVKVMGETMRKHAHGQYINEVNAFDDSDVQRRCFSEDAWQRLQGLKRKYDADDRYHGFVA